MFLYNGMESTGVRQGMGIMHSDVIDTVFHSGDASWGLYAIKLSSSAFRMNYKYYPMLRVWDLLVTFH